ncbi:MAG: hypothetical protein L0I36_05020, partial [Lacticaseibacillus paracasei]|nr:hypothetical protein [Lacticaseibacillus paracasei]
MRELGGKKTGHFMLKVGIYLTVILGMIVQLISPALALAAENPTQAVTGTLTIKNQDEQGSPLNGAKYEIQNESHQVVANSEISKDGQATVPNLPVGNYTATEKQSVSGYTALEQTKNFSVTASGNVTLLFKSRASATLDSGSSSSTAAKPAEAKTPEAEKSATPDAKADTELPNIFTKVALKDGNDQPLGTEVDQQSAVKMEITFTLPATSTPFPAGASFTTTLPKEQIAFPESGGGNFSGDVASYYFDATTGQLTIKLLKATSNGSWLVHIAASFKALTANDSLNQTLVFHTKDQDTKFPITFRSNAKPVVVYAPTTTPQSLNPTGIAGTAKFNLNGNETSKTDPTKWDSDPAKRSKNADMALTLTARGSGTDYLKSLTFSDSDLAKIKVSSAPVNILGGFSEELKPLVAGQDFHAVLSDDKRTVKIYLTGGFKKTTGYQVDYTATIDRSLDDTGKVGSALVEGYRYLTGSQTHDGYDY